MLINCNQAANWMPGNAPLLDDDSFRRSFIDAMPEAWRDSLITSAIDRNVDSIEKIEQHFVRLEMAANKKQADNTDKQRAENQHNQHNRSNNNNNHRGGGRNNNRYGRGGGRGGGSNGRGGGGGGGGCGNGKRSNNNDSQSNKRARTAAGGNSNTIGDNAPCPIHLNGNHTWGQCFKNKDRISDDADKKHSAVASTTNASGKGKVSFKPSEVHVATTDSVATSVTNSEPASGFVEEIVPEMESLSLADEDLTPGKSEHDAHC